MRTATSSEKAVGAVVADRYVIQSKLGEGGMGAVYLATDRNIPGRQVAIKFLHEGVDGEFVTRFRQEAEAAASIGHPNIVAVTDFGTDGRAQYLVMEYLVGATLSTTLRQRRCFTFVEARSILVQVCRALQAAHKKGVVHRDLKPENIFLADTGGEVVVKVLDFGIARIKNDRDTRLTQEGASLGTPAYMAPESSMGVDPDHRADIYAMGCILYELLSGDIPFKGPPLAVTTQHLNAPVPPINDRGGNYVVSSEVEAIILRAMAKKRDERYPSMDAFRLALEAAPATSENSLANLATGAMPVVRPANPTPTTQSGQSSAARARFTPGARTTGSSARTTNPTPTTQSGRVRFTPGGSSTTSSAAKKKRTAKKSGAPIALIAVVLVLLGLGAGVYFGADIVRPYVHEYVPEIEGILPAPAVNTVAPAAVAPKAAPKTEAPSANPSAAPSAKKKQTTPPKKE